MIIISVIRDEGIRETEKEMWNMGNRKNEKEKHGKERKNDFGMPFVTMVKIWSYTVH
jgi:hypothetical protein